MRTPRTTTVLKVDTTATLQAHGGSWRQTARTTPGSHAAVLKGCTCSPTTNAYGRGAGEPHRPLYEIAPDCPLHGALVGGLSTAQWRTL